MAHVDKYSRQELRRILKETYREYDDPSKYENAVDISRSHLNYNMNESIHGSYDFMNTLDDRVEDIINKENPGPNDYFNIEYLTPDILWVIHDDKYSFYGLDGKPAHNLTVWAFENKDSYVSFAIIAAILFAVILYFWRKRKGDEDKTSVSPDETIRYERTEDSDTTLKL